MGARICVLNEELGRKSILKLTHLKSCAFVNLCLGVPCPWNLIRVWWVFIPGSIQKKILCLKPHTIFACWCFDYNLLECFKANYCSRHFFLTDLVCEKLYSFVKICLCTTKIYIAKNIAKSILIVRPMHSCCYPRLEKMIFPKDGINSCA